MIKLNYLAIVVAGLLAMPIGALWYSPSLFGIKWLKYMGWSEEKMKKQKKEAKKAYMWGALASIVMAYVLAHMLRLLGASSLQEALQTAFWLWLGFFAATSISSTLFEDRPFGLYLINAGYYLVSILVAAAILVTWI